MEKPDLTEAIEYDGKPIKRVPSLRTVNTVGTAIYGDTLYFVILFIPLLPLARYSVKRTADGKYQFFGKLPLTAGKKLWLALVILAIPMLLFIEVLSVSASMGV